MDSSRKILQGFGDFRMQLGPLMRSRRKKRTLGAGVRMTSFDDDSEDDSARFFELRQMAQELSAGLRAEGCVTKHFWYYKLYMDTFVADDAVKWISARMTTRNHGSTRAVQLLQELLDCGLIRRVSKRESNSSIGWEASEHVVHSKRRFKHTKHTLYRFDDELSELQLHVEIRQAELESLLTEWNIRLPNVFAKVSLGDRFFETLAIKHVAHPEWRTHFVFGLDTLYGNSAGTCLFESDMLRVTINHIQGPFSSRQLGVILLPVATLPHAVLPTGTARQHSAQLTEFYRWYGITSTKQRSNQASNVETETLSLERSDERSGQFLQTFGRVEVGSCIIRTTTELNAPFLNSNVPRTSFAVAQTPMHQAEASGNRSLYDQTLARNVAASAERPSAMDATQRPSFMASASDRPSRFLPVTTGRALGHLKTQDVVRGGLRRWRLCAFIEICDGVQYDLAETFGIPWIMEVKIIVGSAVAVTNPSDRDRKTKAAIWCERLALDVYANQRVDDVKLVVCQRAKYDLVTRHIGAVSIPLSQIPVVEQGLPEPKWYNLRRMKHGTAGNQHNGTLRASIWLRHIKPLESPPFGLMHLIAWDALVLFFVAFVTRRVVATFLVFLLLLSPIFYLYRFEIKISRIIGSALTLFLERFAPLGLELSFKSVSLEAHVVRGRLHVSAVIDDFAFGNPCPRHIPPTLLTPLSRRMCCILKFLTARWVLSFRRLLRRNSIFKLIASALSRTIALIIARFHQSSHKDGIESSADSSILFNDRITGSSRNTTQNAGPVQHLSSLATSFKRRAHESNQSRFVSTPSVMSRSASGGAGRRHSNAEKSGNCAAIGTVHEDINNAKNFLTLSPHHVYSPCFLHRHFVSAGRVRAEVSACASTVWGLFRFLNMALRDCWNAWRASPAHMIGLRANPAFECQCLGLLRIERLIIEDASLSFCTSHHGRRKGELNVNAVVRRIADTKVALALARARHVRYGSGVFRTLRYHLRILLNPHVQCCRETANAMKQPQFVRTWACALHYANALFAAPSLILRNAVHDKHLFRNPQLNLTWLVTGSRQNSAAFKKDRGSDFDKTKSEEESDVEGWEMLDKDDDDATKTPMCIHWPSVLEGKIYWGRLADTDPENPEQTSCDSRVFKVVIRIRGNRIESTSRPARHPTWNKGFVVRVDDASTVLHVAVYEVRRGFMGSRLCGQWCMTIKYLITNPAYCHHDKLWLDASDNVDPNVATEMPEYHRDLNAPKNKKDKMAWISGRSVYSPDQWVYLTAKLSDAHWRHTNGRLCMRLRWSPSEGSPMAAYDRRISFGYPKPLDQLRTNSEEVTYCVCFLLCARHNFFALYHIADPRRHASDSATSRPFDICSRRSHFVWKLHRFS